jgi:hypothetical protein
MTNKISKVALLVLGSVLYIKYAEELGLVARSVGISWRTNDRGVLSYRNALTSALLAKAKHVPNFRLQHTFPLTQDYVRIDDTGDQQRGSWAYILTSNPSYVTLLSVSCLSISFPIPLLLFLSLLYTLLISFPKN